MKKILFFSTYANRRLLVTLFMGFTSGLPIALCASTLQAWYTVAGVSIATIGALTLVGQPYVYKFLWSPFLDRYAPPFLGRRRGWILLMQLVLAALLLMMSFGNPKINPGWLALLALALAFFSATQDIGIDAYRTDLLLPQERGLGAAMVTMGYRIAMLVSGALALIIAAKIGWHHTYRLMAGLMLLGVLITFWSPEPAQTVRPPQTLRNAVVDPFREFLSRPFAVLILLFIIIYKLTDAFTLALGTPFLIRDVGFSLVDIGAIYKIVGMLATIVGSFVGGVLMMRLGLFRALLLFGFLQGASNLMFMSLAMVGKNYALLVGTVFLENFCGGLGTVALVAFLMSLCDKRYTASQYAVLSALSAIGRVFVGPLAAWMVTRIGWVHYFFWSFMICLPSLMLLWFLRNQINQQPTYSQVEANNKGNCSQGTK